jgi:hypothetical protein
MFFKDVCSVERKNYEAVNICDILYYIIIIRNLLIVTVLGLEAVVDATVVVAVVVEVVVVVVEVVVVVVVVVVVIVEV